MNTNRHIVRSAAFTMLLVAASACALAADDNEPTKPVLPPSPPEAQQVKQPQVFCYLDDKAYSEGAIVGEMECGQPLQKGV